MLLQCWFCQQKEKHARKSNRVRSGSAATEAACEGRESRKEIKPERRNSERSTPAPDALPLNYGMSAAYQGFST
jgi:hypothetical protein